MQSTVAADFAPPAMALIVASLLLGIQGTAIVDNPSPNPSSPAFRLSPTATIRVGGLNNDPHYEIVSYSAATVLPSGNLVVAPTGGLGNSRVLRVYSPPGRFVREIGRAGEGPGEFGRIQSITALRGDSLLVHDSRLSRVALFDASGSMVRTTNSAGRGKCCLSGNTYLVVDGPSNLAMDPGAALPRDSVRIEIGRVGSAQTTSNKVLLVPGYERPICLSRSSAGGPCGDATMRYFVGQPSVELAGNTFIYGNGEKYEYRVYSPGGDHLRTVRAQVSVSRVSRADIDSVRSIFIDRYSGDARRVREAVWAKMALPTSMPAYSRILAEDNGTVWLTGCVGHDQEKCWARFDQTGKLMGVLLVPGGWRVVEFANGHAILEQHDTNTQSRTLEVRRVEQVGGR